MPPVAVTFTTVEPGPTAVVAQTTTWEEYPRLWGQLLGEVYSFVRSRSDLATGEGGEQWQNVMLYKDQRPDVEVGVLVKTPFDPHGRVTASELPGGEVASAVHRGDYGGLGDTHAAVREAIEAQGREPSGPLWEIYGHAREDPSEQETEIFWLLR